MVQCMNQDLLVFQLLKLGNFLPFGILSKCGNHDWA